MGIAETIHLKRLVLKDRLGLGLTSPTDNRIHLDAAIAWLKHAQDVTGNNGVAQTYLVRYQRWAPSYPETTGYIIPTFYRYAALSGDDDARARARKMADWEIEIQHSSGGVLAGALGDSDQPTIFNTGQVIFGWVRAFEEEGDERYRQAAIRAADWLIEVMDDDGCWRKFGSPMTGKQINTYNTRSAWSLARVFDITGDHHYLNAALKNADWAMSQRNELGWLAENCLQDSTQPFTHTIAYAMRGLLEIGIAAEREDLIVAARTIGDAMLAALPPDGKLPGRFNKNWQPTVTWSCLTGDCQLGINWGRLFKTTGDHKYREAASKVLGFVKKTQQLVGPNNDTVGGIKGSHPINGGYHPWQYPNWATKFYADALMMDIANSSQTRYGLTAHPDRND
ncbi:beta-L-arabinofuranosidase domain-containing protein [Dechloromonas hortensis]|uniref:beta-L-arabinofuranosidase domain-containing protein n=1 Tax=Dechloromonas hortensis TaxID=337779 RepID=UPI0012917A6C|nr:beta-L-arabinofuranosidase domain-containing protein [Dechloromonas hortensis]